MMRFAQQHIQTAEKITRRYDGSIPLHHFLKQFFAADKKYGSKDRKAIAHACYCFYRLGHSLKEVPVIEKIKAGIFLCSEEAGIWRTAFDETWINNWSGHLHKRIEFIKMQFPFDTEHIFPWISLVSEAIEKNEFVTAHLVQPDLHIRVRPGMHDKVKARLSAAGLMYETCGASCIALPNATKIGNLVALNQDAVVQDLSSQRIAEFLLSVNNHVSPFRVWDCCAASGGKSILAYDTFLNIDLTVSDIRLSIIQNLKKRFAEAGIKNYRTFVADLSNNYQPSTIDYQLIICDVPCSGSGTWGRNPEQLYFFEEKKIGYYSSLQQQIVSNVIPAVAINGFLLYLTCSVFKEENEKMVEYITANSSLQLQKMEILKGYDKKADTMFAALFKASPL